MTSGARVSNSSGVSTKAIGKRLRPNGCQFARCGRRSNPIPAVPAGRPRGDLLFRIVGGQVPEHADATHPVGLLCAHRERPRQCSAAQRSYEFPPCDIDWHRTLQWGWHAHWI